jgi:hypothetical protein
MTLLTLRLGLVPSLQLVAADTFPEDARQPVHSVGRPHGLLAYRVRLMV